MRSIEERNAIVGEHLQLAKALAGSRYKTVNHTVQYGELLSAAYQGLINAAELFDMAKANPKAKRPFECYARRRIRGQMDDYLRACNWGTRTYTPKVISTETVTRYSGDNRSGRPLSLGDTFHSRDRSIVDQLNGRELFEKIIRCLPQREKRVFRLRYLYTLTMKEIADCVDISESRVSQILSQNTRYLRKVWSNRGDELWDEVGEVH